MEHERKFVIKIGGWVIVVKVKLAQGKYTKTIQLFDSSKFEIDYDNFTLTTETTFKQTISAWEPWIVSSIL